jgi:hypothetical protein
LTVRPSRRQEPPVSASRYARIAEGYWTTYLPSRVAKLPDPERFFARLGADVAEQVQSLEMDLDQRRSGNDYLARVGELMANRRSAEEIALAEMVYLPMEPGTEDREPPAVKVPGVATVDD